MTTGKSIAAACVLATALTTASAQNTGTNDTVTIPRAQYEKFLEEHQKLIEEMKEMKAFKEQFGEFQKKAATQQADTDQAIDDVEKQTKAAKQMAKDSFPGSSKMLLTGYGSAGFIGQDHGGAKNFTATFNPIFLWKLSDRVLFEGEFEAELEGHDTSLALEMAQVSYVLNDYVTLGAGKFLNPMDYFVERQHMGWVNKLPDKPLAVYDGLLPESEVGAQVRGAIPAGPTKFGYAFYVANAPDLQSDTNSVSPSDLGTLGFDNFDNVGKHLATGGRVGFYPLPELEVGYGFQVSEVGAGATGGSVGSLLQSADLSYVRDSVRLQGIINLKAQWVWSHLDKFRYDPNGTIGGPFGFRNDRDGGYAQVAYRPTRIGIPFVEKLEGVFRYDMLSQANTPTGVDETRYTVGLNYWFAPSTVAKVAYEFDHQSGANADRHNAVLLQFVTGF